MNAIDVDNHREHLQNASQEARDGYDSMVRQGASREQLSDYVAMIGDGQLPVWAEMLALRTAPASKTDREYLAGRRETHGFDTEAEAKMMIAAARRIDPNFDPKGKVYESQLCRHKMFADPQAWVESKGDIRRVAERNNWQVEGTVDVDFVRHDEQPMKSGGLRPEIVNDYVDAYIAREPELAEKPRRDLEEMVMDKHCYAKPE